MSCDDALCASLDELELIFSAAHPVSLGNVVHEGTIAIPTWREYRVDRGGALMLDGGLVGYRHGHHLTSSRRSQLLQP